MDAKELRQKSADELNILAADLRGQVHDMGFRVATRQAKQVRELRRLKRELARVLTVKAEQKTTPSTV